MAEDSSNDLALADGMPPRRLLALAAGTMGVLLAATIALWAHYGTAVFFEMIRAGFMACFG
jgi:hypothetical protein